MSSQRGETIVAARPAEIAHGGYANRVGRSVMIVRTAMGAVRRKLLETFDRTIHPLRRKAARQQLGQLPRVQRVLFVCHGNIYRSPWAEAAFRSHLPEELRDRVQVLSAGFVGPGRPAPAESMALAEKQGLDLTAHRSQLLTPALVSESDLVVVMNAAQQVEICRRFNYARRRVLVLGDLDPDTITRREVKDPWNQPVEVLVGSTERIMRCTRELARELAGNLA